MANTFLMKDKKNSLAVKKKRINWNQSLNVKTQKIVDNYKSKKSLHFVLLLRKFNNLIDFKNIKLLKAFLTKYGKIRPRRKTRVSSFQQRIIARTIKKARASGLIPFICDVKL